MPTTDTEPGKVPDAPHIIRYNADEKNLFSRLAATDTRREPRSSADSRDSEQTVAVSRINSIGRRFYDGKRLSETALALTITIGSWTG
jgi:hypothetical protein